MIPVTQPTQTPDDPFAQYGGQVDTTYGSPTSSTSSEGAGGLSGTAQGTNTFAQAPSGIGPGGSISPTNPETAWMFNPDGTLKTKQPASGQPWDQAYFSSTFGQPKTPQELVALEQQITAAGGKVLRNAAGVAGKIQTPDGRVIDVINAAGAGGQGFQWLDGGGGQFGGGNLGSLGYGFGDSMKPINMNFALPTLDQFKASPFYGAGTDAFNRAMQNSAAAKGTLLNGRTNEAMFQSAEDRGLQQYGTLAGLNAGVFLTGVFCTLGR